MLSRDIFSLYHASAWDTRPLGLVISSIVPLNSRTVDYKENRALDISLLENRGHSLSGFSIDLARVQGESTP